MNGRRSPVPSLATLALIVLSTGIIKLNLATCLLSIAEIATASWDGPVEKVEKEESIHELASNKVTQDDQMNERRKTDLDNVANRLRNEVDQNRVDPHTETSTNFSIEKVFFN